MLAVTARTSAMLSSNWAAASIGPLTADMIRLAAISVSAPAAETRVPQSIIACPRAAI